MPRKFLLWSKTHFLPCRKNSFLEDFLMQHTYCISNATPILSYLQCFINIFRADFERSANMPKHPLIKYLPLYPLLHKTLKNRISVLVLSYIPSFILIPLVLPSLATVTGYRVHTTFKKKQKTKHFFGLLGPHNVKIHQNLNQYFSRWQYFLYRESRKCGQKKKKQIFCHYITKNILSIRKHSRECSLG